MSINSYANQSVTLKHRTGTTDTGAPEFDANKTIFVRMDYNRRMVLDAKGNEVISEAQIITSHPLEAGDVLVIDGRDVTVLNAFPIKGLSGKTLHYEAVT